MRVENSFIGIEGVGEATERRLWETGITEWDAFDGRAPGVGETRAERIHAFIAEGRERLAQGDAAFFGRALPDRETWRCYENFRERTCFLDIETTGLDRHADDVTTVSYHRGGETETLVRGRDLTREALHEALADSALLVTFNGARFDVPFLEAEFDLSVALPHVDLYHLCGRVGQGGGLKDVERQFGIERERPDISGRDAVRLWHEYERGDEGALETLVSYNQDDAANLRPLLEAVTDRLHAETLGAVESN